LASKVDVLTTYNKILEAQISNQVSSSPTPLGRLPSNPEPQSREHYNAMILKGANN